MPPRLTALRLRILNLISRLTRLGQPPSAAELARRLGISQPTLAEHVQVLRGMGYLEKTGREGRLRLTDQARAVVQDGIPIYGQIAAGPPLLAEQDPDQRTPSVDALMGVQDGDFFLKVSGDSMTGIGVMDGDFVLVRPAQQLLDGEVAVVLLPDNVSTLKRLYHLGSDIILMSENPDVPRMVYPADAVQVQGRMIGKVGLGVPRQSFGSTGR
ncbi:transcriptional repressor LexA [Deinococcus sp.]|uniref:transcriptional repressor LexA n=1 Tax=Deinococcus sp. TaxID=47478 RepID=UPI003B5B543B